MNYHISFANIFQSVSEANTIITHYELRITHLSSGSLELMCNVVLGHGEHYRSAVGTMADTLIVVYLLGKRLQFRHIVPVISFDSRFAGNGMTDIIKHM